MRVQMSSLLQPHGLERRNAMIKADRPKFLLGEIGQLQKQKDDLINLALPGTKRTERDRTLSNRIGELRSEWKVEETLQNQEKHAKKVRERSKNLSGRSKNARTRETVHMMERLLHYESMNRVLRMKDQEKDSKRLEEFSMATGPDRIRLSKKVAKLNQEILEGSLRLNKKIQEDNKKLLEQKDHLKEKGEKDEGVELDKEKSPAMEKPLDEKKKPLDYAGVSAVFEHMKWTPDGLTDLSKGF